jgi:hypothetical protein
MKPAAIAFSAACLLALSCGAPVVIEVHRAWVRRGDEYLASKFPRLDRIKKAIIQAAP